MSQKQFQPETLYDLLGGDVGVRQLVDRFYDVMDRDSQAHAVRDMHPRDLGESRDKLHEFLSGWMGGPGISGVAFPQAALLPRLYGQATQHSGRVFQA